MLGDRLKDMKNKTIKTDQCKPSPLVEKYSKDAQRGPAFDIGFGGGGDAIFLARMGFGVTAIDISETNVAVLRSASETKNISINAIFQDVRKFIFQERRYSIIVAINSLFFLSKRDFETVVEKIKKALRPGGIAIITSFTTGDPMFVKMQKTKEQADERSFRDEEGHSWNFLASGELEGYFKGFSIFFSKEETVQDKGHLGASKPHTHKIASIVARK